MCQGRRPSTYNPEQQGIIILLLHRHQRHVWVLISRKELHINLAAAVQDKSLRIHWFFLVCFKDVMMLKTWTNIWGLEM